MNDISHEKRANLKTKLGLCNSSWCLRKPTIEIVFPSMGITRYICDKHFKEVEKLLNKNMYKARRIDEEE